MRCLIYSHDTYGLGHLRRSMRIAAAVADREPRAHVLIATGSPVASSFPLPSGVDVVRLPAVTKDESGGYRTRTLGTDLAATVRMRSSLIAASVQSFSPDVMLVDHAPDGLCGELLPVLLGPNRPPRIVLGLRDIIDHAFRVGQRWRSDGVWDLIRAAYDEILVYGDERVCTTAQELEVTRRTGVPVRHVGYVAGKATPAGTQVEGRPQILLTTGGGGDGAPVIERYLSFLETYAPAVDVAVVTGPLLSRRRRARISQASAAIPNLEIHEFVPDLFERMAHSAGVVAMAGYNTTAEILATGVPALLFPRRHPRLEQWIRAERLAQQADLRVAAAEDITDSELGGWTAHCMARTLRQPADLRLDGANGAAAALLSVASIDRIGLEQALR